MLRIRTHLKFDDLFHSECLILTAIIPKLVRWLQEHTASVSVKLFVVHPALVQPSNKGKQPYRLPYKLLHIIPLTLLFQEAQCGTLEPYCIRYQFNSHSNTNYRLYENTQLYTHLHNWKSNCDISTYTTGINLGDEGTKDGRYNSNSWVQFSIRKQDWS